jgi:hypothetical protein
MPDGPFLSILRKFTRTNPFALGMRVAVIYLYERVLVLSCAHGIPRRDSELVWRRTKRKMI